MLQIGIRRILKGFVIAPLIFPVMFYEVMVVTLLISGAYPWKSFSGREFVTGLPLFTILILPLAYLAELLLGVPTWFVFKRYNMRSFAAFAAIGAFLGLLFWIFYVFWAGKEYNSLQPKELSRFGSAYLNALLFPIPACIAGGAVSATLFRAIVFSRPRKAQ